MPVKQKEERPEFDLSEISPEPDPKLLEAGEKLHKKINRFLKRNRENIRKKSRKYKKRHMQENGE